MNVKQFKYSADNLGYLVYGKKSALAIDGGAVEAILSFIDKNRLQLEYVTNTHSHPDHTMGTKDLVNRSGAKYLDNKTVRADKVVRLEEENIQVYHTPGHTKDSVCFHSDNTLITGDTLFNGTVGNCYSGDLDGFLESVSLLMSFPDETLVYAGHDYVEGSMDFARRLEPENKDIKLFLKKYDPNHVCSTLSDEKKVNPYVKYNDEKMIRFLEKRGFSVKTENERWRAIMSIE
ncbi:MAG: MBL fold metallo-hydrolase [Desulfobacteraceae bacterium]|nr:MBL fold metallo-hydrolase [Desulfobacteraceae bacterium]